MTARHEILSDSLGLDYGLTTSRTKLIREGHSYCRENACTAYGLIALDHAGQKGWRVRDDSGKWQKKICKPSNELDKGLGELSEIQRLYSSRFPRTKPLKIRNALYMLELKLWQNSYLFPSRGDRDGRPKVQADALLLLTSEEALDGTGDAELLIIEAKDSYEPHEPDQVNGYLSWANFVMVEWRERSPWGEEMRISGVSLLLLGGNPRPVDFDTIRRNGSSIAHIGWDDFFDLCPENPFKVQLGRLIGRSPEK